MKRESTFSYFRANPANSFICMYFDIMPSEKSFWSWYRCVRLSLILMILLENKNNKCFTIEYVKPAKKSCTCVARVNKFC